MDVIDRYNQSTCTWYPMRTPFASVLTLRCHSAAICAMTEEQTNGHSLTAWRRLHPAFLQFTSPASPRYFRCLVLPMPLMNTKLCENALFLQAPLAKLAYALGTEPLGMTMCAELHSPSSAVVFLNGHILGVHCRPEWFAKAMRMLRRAGRIGSFVSVYTEPGRCAIAADGGRVCRPLIIADEGVPRVTDTHIQQLKVRRSLGLVSACVSLSSLSLFGCVALSSCIARCVSMGEG